MNSIFKSGRISQDGILFIDRPIADQVEPVMAICPYSPNEGKCGTHCPKFAEPIQQEIPMERTGPLGKVTTKIKLVLQKICMGEVIMFYTLIDDRKGIRYSSHESEA